MSKSRHPLAYAIQANYYTWSARVAFREGRILQAISHAFRAASEWELIRRNAAIHCHAGMWRSRSV